MDLVTSILRHKLFLATLPLCAVITPVSSFYVLNLSDGETRADVSSSTSTKLNHQLMRRESPPAGVKIRSSKPTSVLAQGSERAVRDAETPSRMRWWVPAGDALPATNRYLLFSNDAGGLNNIRIGWEMAGVIAKMTNRTFVLPPAGPMFLLDFGPMSTGRAPESVQHNTSRTKVEDLINLKQLKANLPTLTAEEFEERVGMPWEDATKKSKRSRGIDFKARGCDLKAYQAVDEDFLFMDGSDDRQGFSCGDWAQRGGPNDILRPHVDNPAWALLTHGFMWHPDAFDIAAKVVNYMGLFGYIALHARYNEFQFHEQQQSPQSILKALHIQPGSMLYVATDEPDKFKGMNAQNGIRVLMWDDLFGKSAQNVLSTTKANYTDDRWFKLTGPVEELICTYAKMFVGTKLSSFSGHIQRMRIHAAAPVTSIHVHTDPLSMMNVSQEIDEWTKLDKLNKFTSLPATTGNIFVQLTDEATL